MADYTTAYVDPVATPENSGGFSFGNLMNKVTDVLSGWASAELKNKITRDSGGTQTNVKRDTSTALDSAVSWAKDNWPLLVGAVVALGVVFWLVKKI